ncbi:hypothetical protein EAM_1055 [Erwinia amylovora ATCC 49946]|nr:hypothetical protein EAM_1055 [Erwinia amylovora ATCC 49946]
MQSHRFIFSYRNVSRQRKGIEKKINLNCMLIIKNDFTTVIIARTRVTFFPLLNMSRGIFNDHDLTEYFVVK